MEDTVRLSPLVIRIRGRAARGSNMGPGWASRCRSWGDARPSGSLKKRGHAAKVRKAAERNREREVAALQRGRDQRAEVVGICKALGIDPAVLTQTGRAARVAKRAVSRVQSGKRKLPREEK